MSNLRIIHENWTDDLTLTVTSEEGDFTKDRMQMPVAKDVWRATSAAIQRITGDFGQLRRVGALHLENVNYTDGAVITATLENPPLTHTRSDPKWLFDADGVVVEVADGVPGFGPNGLTIDPQRTNLLDSGKHRDFGSWDSGGATVAADETGIDGSANSARTITDDDAGSIETKNENITISDDGTDYSYYIFPQIDSDETRFPEFQIRLSGGTAKNEAVQINTSSLDTSERLSDGSFFIGTSPSSTWAFLDLRITNNSTGNTTLSVQAIPAITASLGGLQNTATGSIIVDWATVVNALFVGRPIPGATTRNADVVSRSTPDRLDADKTNYLYGKYTPFAQAMGEVFLECYRIDADNYVAVILNDTQLILRRRFHGTNHDATLAFTYTAGTTFEWHAVVSKTRGAIWGDGTKGTDNTDTVPLRFASTVHFASDGNTGGIGSGEIADYAFGSDTGLLTGAQIAQLPDSSILPMVIYPMRGSLDCKPYAATFNKWPDDLVMASATHWFNDAGGLTRTASDGTNRTTAGGNTRTTKANFTRPLAESFILDIDDPNNADGYVEHGRLVLGDYFESQETNARYGYRLGYVEMSQSSRTRGGSLRSENEDPFRVQSFSWEFLTDHGDELYELVDRLWRNRGIRNDIVVSAFPEDGNAKTERLNTMLGRMTNVDGAEYYVNASREVPGTYGRIYRVSFTVEETL